MSYSSFKHIAKVFLDLSEPHLTTDIPVTRHSRIKRKAMEAAAYSQLSEAQQLTVSTSCHGQSAIRKKVTALAHRDNSVSM